MSWEDSLGVKAAHRARIFTILSPVGPYYPRGFVPVKLYCDTDVVRAWPHGHGAFKIGGNYAPTIRPQRLAQAKGYDQILWLTNGLVCESGAMNIFMYLQDS